MTTNKIEKWETEHGEVETTANQLRAALRVPKADDAELYRFIEICRAQKLNPFLGEVYLVKYDDSKPASYVVGKDAFTQRAEANPDFDGIEAGIIVKRGENVDYIIGTFHLPTDSIVGGWARVYRKNLKVPIEKSVSFTEYSTGRSLWKSKPATMIEKVAIVQALREAFPSKLAGLYERGELQQEDPGAALVVDRVAADVDDARAAEVKPEPPQLAYVAVQEVAPVADEFWTKFTDFVHGQNRTLDDVAEVIGSVATPESIKRWARAVGAKSMSEACEIMAAQWREADAMALAD